MLKLENSIRGLSFSRVAFDLTIQGILIWELNLLAAIIVYIYNPIRGVLCQNQIL